MQNEQTKFIPRTQMQSILDNAPQGVDKKALIDKFVSDGFKVEGINDKPEPNIAQTVVGGLIKAPTDLIGAGFAGAGALGAYAGKKLAGQDTTLAQEYANQSQQVKESGANAIVQPLTGQEIRPAQNAEELAGDVIQTGALLAPGSTVGRAALSGAGLLGGMAMSENKSAEEVAKQALLGGVTGGAIASVIPGLAKLASVSKTIEKQIETGLAKGIKSDEVASSILQRQLKLNPVTGNQKFQEISGGMLPGDYLVQKGIFDTREEAVNKLAQDWAKSYNLKKETLKLLPDQYTFNPANEALKELTDYEAKTGVAGTSGKFTKRINELLNASKSRGLTLNEIDDIKNIYENTVKLGYGKEINTIGTERATRIDNALRNFIEEKASAQGFTNVKELNKNTQLSRFLAQAIEDKIAGQSSNNFLTLTDTIIGAGATIDPSALVVLAGKKIIGSEKVQAELAKRFAKSISKDIKAEVSQSTKALLNPSTNKVEADFLVAPAGSKVGQFESTTKKIATSGQKTNQVSPQELGQKLDSYEGSVAQPKNKVKKAAVGTAAGITGGAGIAGAAPESFDTQTPTSIDMLEGVKYVLNQKETSGGKNYSKMDNETGKTAVGPYQITKALFDSVKKRFSEDFKDVAWKDLKGNKNLQENLMDLELNRLLDQGLTLEQVFGVWRKGLKGASTQTGVDYSRDAMKIYNKKYRTISLDDKNLSKK